MEPFSSPRQKFLICQEMELSHISSVIKSDFLIFLVLKDKKSCCFSRRTPQVFSFFTSFSVSLFTILGCFYYSLFSSIFIIQCFHFSPFSGVFVLLYRECYVFERAFFTLRRFLPYTPSRHLAQSTFIKASLGAGSSSLKVAKPLDTQTRPKCLFESHSDQQNVSR